MPHTNYAAAKGASSSMIEDLTIADGESHPASFLTADDVDDYIFSVDNGLSGDQAVLPTLAPRAHPGSHLSSHPHLKNPTSVTNWLRKHAPKIFLQDGETHDDAPADAAGADAASTTGHAAGSSSRKSRGGRAERGGKTSTRGKRASGVSRTSNVAAEKGADWDASMDEEADYSTPVGRGKRKRKDDAGYRPGGSASRPSKKKRKSDADGTPSASARRSKKEAAAE